MENNKQLGLFYRIAQIWCPHPHTEHIKPSDYLIDDVRHLATYLHIPGHEHIITAQSPLCAVSPYFGYFASLNTNQVADLMLKYHIMAKYLAHNNIDIPFKREFD